jgi:hypothetical protein
LPIVLLIGSLELIGSLLQVPGQLRSAIVALPSLDPSILHFVVLVDADANLLIVCDASSGKEFKVPVKKALERDVPLLLIGTDRSVADEISNRKRLSRLAISVISSEMLAVALIAILCLWTSQALAPTCSDFARATLLVARFRHAVNLARKPKVILCICIGTSLGLGIIYVSRIELHPLIADATVLDLGSKPIGSVQTATFRIQNRSLWRTCKIENVRATCSCLEPELNGSVIRAGKSAIVRIKIMVLSGGEAEHSVLITPNSALPEFAVKIRFKWV